MAILKLDEIKISSAFSESVPSEKKMAECRYNWNVFNAQDRYIILNDDYYLIDGYIQYLVLKENGSECAEVRFSNKKRRKWHRKQFIPLPKYRNESTTYIYGVHPNSKEPKTYMWRVPESWTCWAENIQIGDTIMCATKNGYAPVLVNKIEILDRCPIDIPVKKVCNRQIRRNGMVVEV